MYRVKETAVSRFGQVDTLSLLLSPCRRRMIEGGAQAERYVPIRQERGSYGTILCVSS